MPLRNLGFKLTVAGFACAVLFVLPAMSAPISVFPKDPLKIVPSDDAQILLVRGERGGARGGAARGGAVARGGAARGGAVYRGGAVVRGGTVATGGGGYYAGGYCDPSYQYCGGGAPYVGGVYRGGAVAGGAVRGGAYARGGAVARGGGAHVAHRGGARRR
jgi:hypothetical protein